MREGRVGGKKKKEWEERNSPNVLSSLIAFNRDSLGE